MNEAQTRIIARFEDLVRRAVRTGGPVYSAFMDPDAQKLLCALARREGLETGTYGGFPDAERAVVGLWQQGREPEESPVRVICLKWDGRYAAPQHRDVLGAYLGLGLERETLGDIRLKDNAAYLVVLPAMASYLEANLESVGRTGVKVCQADGPMPEAERGTRAVVNVPSLRLDAVLAQTLRLARAKAQTLIKGGAVRRNWQDCDRVDAEVGEGDLLSVRGQGRVKVLEVKGESRKGRLFIEVETFLKP